MIKYTNILILILIIVVSIKIKNNLIIMEKYTQIESGKDIGDSSHTTSTTALKTVADSVIRQSELIQELNNEIKDRNQQIQDINTDIATKITNTDELLGESDSALDKLRDSL